jgi:hypothetical protein
MPFIRQRVREVNAGCKQVGRKYDKRKECRGGAT